MHARQNLSGNFYSPGLIDQIVEEGRLGQDPASKERGKDLVAAFVKQVIAGQMTVTRNPSQVITERVAQIDRLISLQLNEVLHHPEFQKLEAAWRGLSYLTKSASWYKEVKVRVFNASKRELLHDFREEPSPSLTEAIVDLGSNTLGSEPFSVLVGNYWFTTHPEDIDLLARLARTSSAAYAPFLAACDSRLLNRDSFTELVQLPVSTKTFDTDRYTSGKALRRRPFAKFAVLALPGILLRRPYSTREAFDYNEGVDGRDDSKFLWANPAWAMAAQLARAFGKGSWCADPAAEEGGVVIYNLASFEFPNDAGDSSQKGPTEVPITDTQYTQLCKLGFAPICCDTTRSRALIFEIPTIYQPPMLGHEDGTVFKPPPTMLRDVLVHSRVAQYIKCIVREKRGWFETPQQCERYLNRWAAKYTVPESGRETPDKYGQPFLEAEFQVVKDHDKPEGWFRVEGHVLPNLAKPEAAVPVEISVPVLLKCSAGVWEPSSEMIREDVVADVPEPAPVTESRAAAMISDPAAAAFDALERLAALRRQQILSDAEYLELKEAVLARIRFQFAPPPMPPAKKAMPEAATTEFSAPFADLHAQIVDSLSEPYRNGETPKQRAQRSLGEMAAKQAVNAQDMPLLTELLDSTMADVDGEVEARVEEVGRIAERIRVLKNASPASRAIAETARQSGARAATAAGETGPKIWRRLVWPDVEGAFSGGAAASAVFPAFAAQFPWPLQIAAAFGVVVGAGIRSAVAYGENVAQSDQGLIAP